MLDDPTVEQVRELLVRAVEERGADYVYPRANSSACLYREPDGSPSCIVGHVLTWAGVQILSHHEGSSAYAVTPDTWDSGITEALTEAQHTQDRGRPWGEALAAFDKSLGLVQS